MKDLFLRLISGRNNSISGLFALAIVGLIALGCTCGKDFDLSNIGKESNTTSTSNTADNSTTPFSTPAPRTVTKSDASKGVVPEDAELQEMIKATLLDFNSALQAEDFTSFHAKICKPWQKQTSPESLKTSFQGFIDKDISISDIAALDAEFSPSPEVGREVGYKTLKLKGAYKTSPNQTKFELNYIPEGKDWKLSKIVVDTTQPNY